VAIGLAFVTGVGNSILNAYAISIIMTRAPQEMLGRVNAAIEAIIQTGSTLGIVLSGIAITAFTVRPVVFVSAILSAVIVFIFAPDVIRYSKAFADEKAAESAA
jgi:MFS family permease